MKPKGKGLEGKNVVVPSGKKINSYTTFYSCKVLAEMFKAKQVNVGKFGIFIIR